jgi:transcriptional regulator PpsR
MPQAFVVLDTDGRILDTNAAFLDMLGLPSAAQARGQMLTRWLGRANVDANVLYSNLREHGTVRDFATVMQGEYGTAEDVEISGAAVGSGATLCFGLIIHSLAHRRGTKPAVGDPARTADQLAELVGRMPLKELVRETTEITERLCISTALKLTGDNRAAASQMLGLSRQSLYDKLRRYNMGDLGRSEDDEQ